ncbi:MAG: hypothetical protein HFJ84_01310 [Clostridiales bacterium]|nr:hypothetical protein [Clostridiales bacterium]
MPYIRTQVSISLSKEKEIALKEKLGQAITILPGKTERWLMLDFRDQCRMYFQGGQEEAAAFVEVKLFGTAGAAVYQEMTAAVTKIISEELGIPAQRIYVQYEECSYWGWNGNNF